VMDLMEVIVNAVPWLLALVETVDELRELLPPAQPPAMPQVNCPKSEDWFVRGGRCGWAHECKDCPNNPDPEAP
jgi:hypothetical protein